MDNDTIQAIRTRLAAGQAFLVTSHIRPDGDAVGSLLGLGLALKDAGKSVQMVLADGVPASFRHLQGADEIKTAVDGDFDTFITVDCADFKRTGKAFAASRRPDINIDHHITNETIRAAEPDRGRGGRHIGDPHQSSSRMGVSDHGAYRRGAA